MPYPTHGVLGTASVWLQRLWRRFLLVMNKTHTMSVRTNRQPRCLLLCIAYSKLVKCQSLLYLTHGIMSYHLSKDAS